MPKRGMEAVASKQSDMERELRAKLKRKPVMQRKGEGKPGVAVMIAIGKPKGDMMGEGKGEMLKDELDASKGEGLSKDEKIAALEEKIGYLKAELALLQDDMDESEDDSEDSEDEGESEDEYEDED